jgi:hypothetical protein
VPPRRGPGEGEVRGVAVSGAASPRRGPGGGEVGGVGDGGAVPLLREVGGGCPIVLGGRAEDSEWLEPSLAAGGRRGRGLLRSGTRKARCRACLLVFFS